MSRLPRFVLFSALLLLLAASVPPPPAFSNGDPDEVIERNPPPAPELPPWMYPGGPRGFRGGDSDEFPASGELGDSGGALEGGPAIDPGGESRDPGWWLVLRTLHDLLSITP